MSLKNVPKFENKIMNYKSMNNVNSHILENPQAQESAKSS